jgi:hypothetical protein
MMFEYFLFVCSYIIISNGSIVIIIIVVVVIIVLPVMQIDAFVAVNLSIKCLFRLSSWTARPLKMGPIGCSETSVGSYNSTLRKTPKERRPHLHRDGSLFHACTCIICGTHSAQILTLDRVC